VVTGPSGVGKGTLIRALMDRVPELELSVSATTRAPRTGEEEGRHYHFLSPEDFARRVEGGDFLEHASYAGNRYGTLRSELERPAPVVLLEVELQGARQVREAMPGALRVFIEPPSDEDLRTRLEGRGLDSPEAVENRLEVAREELAAAHEFEHRIVNDDLGRATDELVGLVATIVGTQTRGAPQ
jgi:guanylate kinase